ncbi:hypothetical protein [Novosphingobium sp.]|uniref:hypothetical protein n=1 Tax=Novosphingobium sp. TaxID=1874826 RepID=UPI00286E6CE8|nr:hypothetical protein [Novosphingobium sp.]
MAALDIGFCSVSVEAAPGKKDELQVDWAIPADAFAPGKGEAKPGGLTFSFSLVPARMLVANEPVKSGDGKALLPKSAQLYLMVGSRLLACSQDQFAAGFVGSSNRVCVLDSDGNGRFDAYFLRSRGRSFMTGDQMWFAMNDSMPTRAMSLKDFAFVDGDPLAASQRPKIDWHLVANDKGQVSSVMRIEDKHSFGSLCPWHAPAKEALPDELKVPCGAGDFIVHAWNLTKPRAEQRVELLAPNRTVKVRFDVDPRLMGARLMSGMYFE